MADLVAHYENLGMAQSFSTVERWCMRCTGTLSEKMKKGHKRTVEDIKNWLQIIEGFEGNQVFES